MWLSDLLQVLANMRKEEMKRQDHIHELITTERNHITNLKILIKVFKNKLQVLFTTLCV